MMSEDTNVVPLKDGIDFDQKLFDMNDEPIASPKEDGPLRLGDVVCDALLASAKDDNPDGTVKIKRFNLARKVMGNKTDDNFPSLNLKAKEVTMILELSAKVWPTLIHSRIAEAIDGPFEDEE